MEQTFAGAGKKRPQLNIPLTLLDLDNQNPRITEDTESASQLELLQILYDNFDLAGVAFSMVANGYFDEEPIVVVPQSLPSEYFTRTFESLEERQAYLQELVNTAACRFTVVEGNRRTATAKLLTDSGLRDRMYVRGFPEPITDGVREDLSILPAICYTARKDVAPYLGVRHITGVLKWGAYAKARYIAASIEAADQRIPELERLKTIQAEIGDRTDAIRKQYIVYKVLQEAEDELSFDTERVKQRFSLLTLAISSPSIRQFIGMETFKHVDINHEIVPLDKLSNLELLLTWIFGDGKGGEPVLTDSRQITSMLAYVVASDEGVKYLIQTDDLEQAYDRIRGAQELDNLVRNLTAVVDRLDRALQLAYRYPDDETVKILTDRAFGAVQAIQKILN